MNLSKFLWESSPDVDGLFLELWATTNNEVWISEGGLNFSVGDGGNESWVLWVCWDFLDPFSVFLGLIEECGNNGVWALSVEFVHLGVVPWGCWFSIINGDSTVWWVELLNDILDLEGDIQWGLLAETKEWNVFVSHTLSWIDEDLSIDLSD